MKQFLLFLSIVLLASCRTVPPSVIGTETRHEIQEVRDTVAVVASEAQQIDDAVDEVSSDIKALESKAPKEMQGELKAIGEKVHALSLLTETHLETSIPAVLESVGTVVESFDKDMEAVAVVEYEKKQAELRVESVKSQRNTLLIIILMYLAVVGAILAVRRFIPLSRKN